MLFRSRLLAELPYYLDEQKSASLYLKGDPPCVVVVRSDDAGFPGQLVRSIASLLDEDVQVTADDHRLALVSARVGGVVSRTYRGEDGRYDPEDIQKSISQLPTLPATGGITYRNERTTL